MPSYVLPVFVLLLSSAVLRASGNHRLPPLSWSEVEGHEVVRDGVRPVVVVIGPTGAGKSHLLNSLIDVNYEDEALPFGTKRGVGVTKGLLAMSTTVNNVEVTLVDAPGFGAAMYRGRSNDELVDLIIDGVLKEMGYVSAIFYVTSVKDWEPSNIVSMSAILNRNGVGDILKVVVTHCDTDQRSYQHEKRRL